MKKAHSEDKFKQIFECIPSAILLTDCSALIKLDRNMKSLKVKNVNRFLQHRPDLLIQAFKKIKILKANQAAFKLYEANSRQQLVDDLSRSFSKKNLSKLVDEFMALTRMQRDYRSEFKFKNLKRKVYDIRLKFSIFSGYERSLSKVLFVLEDITQEKKQEHALMKMSQLDSLTGLFNHKAIAERLDQELTRARRHNLDISCMMIDVDHFKWINDQFGHQRGDHLIKDVGCIIRNTLRRSDVVGRYGGDEFLVILPETNPQNAVAAALRIQKYFYAGMGKYFKENQLKNALSIGISGYPFKGVKTYADLIALADKMMYGAKTSGGNRILHPQMRSQRIQNNG